MTFAPTLPRDHFGAGLDWADTSPYGATATRSSTHIPGSDTLRAMLGGLVLSPAFRISAEALFDGWVLTVAGATSTGLLISLRPSIRRVEAPVRPDEAIAQIRATLSLNVSEIARVLGVERTTVYSWLSGVARPQTGNLTRLARILDVAMRWGRRTSEALGAEVRDVAVDGTSVVSLLSQDPLPDSTIDARLDQAMARIRAGAEGSSTRFMRLRNTMAATGIPIADRGARQGEIDWLTRKPLGPEG